jgi:hypothetical protein
MTEQTFRIGDYVATIVDPRHVARIDAILYQTTLRVTFTETRWRGELRAHELQLVERPPAAITTYNKSFIARRPARPVASHHAPDSSPRPRPGRSRR